MYGSTAGAAEDVSHDCSGSACAIETAGLRCQIVLDVLQTLAKRSTRPPARKSRARTRPRASEHPRKPLVLVVDDNPENLLLVQATLESAGFEVCSATGGLHMFDCLKEREPKVILMDIQMPGMDGWMLTKRLKQNQATTHIPVIALTAYGRPGDDDRAREIGFAEIIQKPISTRELPNIVRKYLG
jgi:two-component system, cell cycle response regulator DivK